MTRDECLDIQCLLSYLVVTSCRGRVRELVEVVDEELSEFLLTFIQRIEVNPVRAEIRYTIAIPADSPSGSPLKSGTGNFGSPTRLGTEGLWCPIKPGPDGFGAIAGVFGELSEFVLTSALTETCAFSCAFIQRFEVMPGFSVTCYTMPMPEDKAGPRSSRGREALGPQFESGTGYFWSPIRLGTGGFGVSGAFETL